MIRRILGTPAPLNLLLLLFLALPAWAQAALPGVPETFPQAPILEPGRLAPALFSLGRPEEKAPGTRRGLPPDPGPPSAQRPQSHGAARIIWLRFVVYREGVVSRGMTIGVLRRHRYDAYGVVLSEETYTPAAGALTDTQITSGLKYKGQTFDAETGQVYLRNRYYEPETGQFTQVDPARAGDNWYAYAGGDPVNRFDPSGLYWIYRNEQWEWEPDINTLAGLIAQGGGFSIVAHGGSDPLGLDKRRDEVATLAGPSLRAVFASVSEGEDPSGPRHFPNFVVVPDEVLDQGLDNFNGLVRDLRRTIRQETLVAVRAAIANAQIEESGRRKGTRTETEFRFITGETIPEGFHALGVGAKKRIVHNLKEFTLTFVDVGQGASVVVHDAAGRPVDVELQSQLGQALASGEATVQDVVLGFITAPYNIGEQTAQSIIDVREGEASLEEVGGNTADLVSAILLNRPGARPGRNKPRHQGSRERPVAFDSFEQARNAAFDLVGDIDPATRSPLVGRLGALEGRVIGFTGRSPAGVHRSFRLDFDPEVGPEINVAVGKGASRQTFSLQFPGTLDDVLNLLERNVGP